MKQDKEKGEGKSYVKTYKPVCQALGWSNCSLPLSKYGLKMLLTAFLCHVNLDMSVMWILNC